MYYYSDRENSRGLQGSAVKSAGGLRWGSPDTGEPIRGSLIVNDLIIDFIDFQKGDFQKGDFQKSGVQSAIETQSCQPLEIIKDYLARENRDCMAGQAGVDEAKPPKEEPQAITVSLSEEAVVKDMDLSDDDYYNKTKMLSGGVPDNESEYMCLLYSETNKRLLPYVTEALDSYEYDGSPAYSGRVEKEFIAEIVDKAVELAARGIVEVSEIRKEMHRHQWTPNRIIRACIEALTLNELFYRRKIMFTSVLDIKEQIFI